MRATASAAARLALEFLFPSRCVSCRAEGSLLCTACLGRCVRLGVTCRRCALPVGGGNLCGRCAQEAPPLNRLVSVFQFGGPVRDAVLALKYDDLRAIAPVLANEMAAHPSAGRMTFDVIVPVPLHPSRLRRRGYNQSELLAKNIGRTLGRPVEPRLLRRVKDTPPLARGVGEDERRRAMAGAFQAAATARGRRVLLVDDVATTCSTLNACATALKAAGAAWVGALTLAREV